MFGASIVPLKYKHPTCSGMALVGEGRVARAHPAVRQEGLEPQAAPHSPWDGFCKCPASLPGSTGNATASRPSSVPNPDSSMATLKPKPSLESPACPGPSVTSQVRQTGGVGAQSWSPGTSSGNPEGCPSPFQEGGDPLGAFS